MNYETKYSEMIKELSENLNVTISKNDFFLKDELLPGFIENHISLKEFNQELSLLNDNFFSWSYKSINSSEIMPMGEFHLFAIEQALSKANEEKITLNINSKKTNKIFYPFDDHPDSGDGVMICFKFISNKYELWLHNENGEMFLINLNLHDYLNKTFHFKALFGWQYLFIDINWNLSVFSVVKSDLNKRLEILNRLFPKYSYSRYFVM